MPRWGRFLLALSAVGLGVAYANRRRIIAQLGKLPPPQYRVQVTRNIAVRARDGIQLMTDHYAPVGTDGTGVGDFPTILIRSPYGRGHDNLPASLVLAFTAERFAERGYHVVVQTTRGQFDSGGEFVPYINEKADGLATIDWIQGQSWFNGVLGTWGPSYLGIVQWAVAKDAPPSLKAMVPMINGSKLSTLQYTDGAFGLGGSLSWSASTAATSGTGRKKFADWFKNFSPDPELLARAEMRLPIYEADLIAAGRPVPFYRRWLDNPPGAPQGDTFWREADFDDAIPNLNAAVHLVSGWYDIWVRETLADYAALKAAGKNPYLTFGPWPHVSPGPLTTGFSEGLKWFDAHLKGDFSRLRRKPVRIFVMAGVTGNSGEWREMEDWPPPSAATRYHLRAGRTLTLAAPSVDESPAHYRYDPAQPTPQHGGAFLGEGAGRVDNRILETRKDVLVYSTPPLQNAVEIIGAVKLELYVQSSLAHTDFLGRLCDVTPDGVSTNVCEGLFRIEPGKSGHEGEMQPDGTVKIVVDLWPTAQRFDAGHRIRLMVASGAHPHWSRNTGSGEPLAHAVTLCAADQKIYHDDAHPSAVILPVTSGL